MIIALAAAVGFAHLAGARTFQTDLSRRRFKGILAKIVSRQGLPADNIRFSCVLRFVWTYRDDDRRITVKRDNSERTRINVKKICKFAELFGQNLTEKRRISDKMRRSACRKNRICPQSGRFKSVFRRFFYLFRNAPSFLSSERMWLTSRLT